MIAIVIKTEDRSVIVIIDDVASVTESDVIGHKGDACKGVNPDLASIIVTDSYEIQTENGMRKLVHKTSGNVVELGDPLPTGVIDKREQLPKTPELQIEQESVDTMLALTEAYELILQQQSLIDALTARITALEGGVV